MLVDAIKLVLFPAVMAYAASSDFLTMTISNRISLILIGGFVGLAVMMGMPVEEIGQHFAAGGLVLAVTIVLFAFGWIGGGDAKLASATALWFGWPHLMDYALYASLLGGVLTLGLLEFRKYAMPSLLVGRAWAERLHKPDGDVPYGIALAIAALAIYPYTIWMETLGR